MAMAIRPTSVVCNGGFIQQQRAGIPLHNGRPRAEKTSMCSARRTRASAQSSALVAQDTVRVRFSTHFQAAFGESLKLVGSSSAVGAWDVAAAPGMSWTYGNVWALDLDLPEHADFEYKIVHVHYNGTSWESCQNRLFQVGPALPDQAALDISCAYNHPELTMVQLAPIEALASLDGEDTWDPSAQGLPADLTEELSQKGVENSSSPEQEPEPVVSRSWAEVQQEAPVFQTEAAVAVEQAVQQAALQEEAAPEKQTAQGPAAAAGAVALALGAGVVMSALAIDLTDAALASAILAAGATFLPAKDAQDARKTMSKVMAGGLNATEAIARGFGLKSHIEQRAEREASLKAQEQLGEQEDFVAAPADDNITLVSPSAGVLLGMTDMRASSSKKALAESGAEARHKKEVAH